MTTPQIAQGLAALGRNGDSVLVHMTPDEVSGLQSIAQAQGGSLTVNPSTGLPEASFLGGFFKSFSPFLAGLAVSMIPGAPAFAPALAGGITGAVTNKKNPIMGAGLGALGGYSGGTMAGKMAEFGSAATQAGIDPAVAAVSDPNTAAALANQNAVANASALNAGNNLGNQFTQNAFNTNAGIAYGDPNYIDYADAVTPTQTFGGNFQQAISNVAQDPMKFIEQNKMALALPVGGAALQGLAEANEIAPGMTEEEYKAQRRARFNRPLNLNEGTPLNLAATGGEIRLAAGGAIAFDDGGSVPSSKLSLRREEEQIAPAPVQEIAQPAQTELGIAALKPGAENEVKIGITNAQLSPVLQEGQQIQPLADRVKSEGIPALVQELGGQGVDFEKLYGKTQAPSPMAAAPAPRGFGPDGRRLAAGGAIQTGGVMDIYQGTDSQPAFGGDQGYGLGRLSNLAGQQSMARAEQGSFAKGGAPRLEDGGFVVPADVVFYLGNHNTEAGQKRLAKMYGAHPIKGKGTGLSDSISTSIEGKEPAKIANGEAYIPRKVVNAHGGPKKFYDMMAKVRKKATGSTKQARSA